MSNPYPRLFHPTSAELRKMFVRILSEDIGSGDVTSENIPNRRVYAEVISNSSGVLSGVVEVKVLLSMYDIKVAKAMKDGSRVEKGDIVLGLNGNSRKMLMTERTVLNILSRMSGISTLTRKYVDAAKQANPRIRVAATRKTTPGFRYFEKKACVVGGAVSHRTGLFDMALIKDTHMIVFGSVDRAVSALRRGYVGAVEVEVSSFEDARDAILGGADIVMLDNLLPNKIKKIVNKLTNEGLTRKVMLEASGGVTLKNIKAYAKSGVDVISVGRITSSAQSLDYSMKVRR
ncbi:MAG: carboxylating nicotinate-nucleotide diphosphorylase [Candidatus Altiarchaeota archaeon]